MDKIVITEELLERINAKARLAKQEDDEEWIVQGIETSLAAVTSGEKCKAYFADDDTAEYIAAVCPDVVLALIGELRKLEAMCEWLAANVRSDGDYDTKCPYYTGFDTKKKCPLWTDEETKSDIDFDSVEEWKAYAFEDEDGEYSESVNCGTDPAKCWLETARITVEEQQ